MLHAAGAPKSRGEGSLSPVQFSPCGIFCGQGVLTVDERGGTLVTYILEFFILFLVAGLPFFSNHWHNCRAKVVLFGGIEGTLALWACIGRSGNHGLIDAG